MGLYNYVFKVIVLDVELKRSLEFWKRPKEALSFSCEPQLLVGLGSLPAIARWQVKVCPLLDGAGDQPWEVGRTTVAQGDILERE